MPVVVAAGLPCVLMTGAVYGLSQHGMNTMTNDMKRPGRPSTIRDRVKFSVSLGQAALDKLDRWAKRVGCSSRSEAVRRLIGRLK